MRAINELTERLLDFAALSSKHLFAWDYSSQVRPQDLGAANWLRIPSEGSGRTGHRCGHPPHRPCRRLRRGSERAGISVA